MNLLTQGDKVRLFSFDEFMEYVEAGGHSHFLDEIDVNLIPWGEECYLDVPKLWRDVERNTYPHIYRDCWWLFRVVGGARVPEDVDYFYPEELLELI